MRTKKSNTLIRLVVGLVVALGIVGCNGVSSQILPDVTEDVAAQTRLAQDQEAALAQTAVDEHEQALQEQIDEIVASELAARQSTAESVEVVDVVETVETVTETVETVTETETETVETVDVVEEEEETEAPVIIIINPQTETSAEPDVEEEDEDEPVLVFDFHFITEF